VNVRAMTTDEPFDLPALLALFQEEETVATGTVVIHHGKVKQPGKKIPDFSRVELRSLVPDPGAALSGLAARAAGDFGANQVLVVHRLGTVDAGQDVLLVMVSAPTRKAAFNACAWLVDAVKEEKIIQLTELP